MDVDLRATIDRLVERQKEYIREDREKYSCAMVVIVSPEGLHLDFPKFHDHESEMASYGRLVQIARAKKATVIITFNDARSRTSKPENGFSESEHREIETSPADRSLLITMSGPGMVSQGLEMPFELSPNGVIFGSLHTLSDVRMNLLPGWPDNAERTKSTKEWYLA